MLVAGLDFETANSGISICQAGVAILEDGKTVEKRSWLIRPHRQYCWFSENNTRIHGLTYMDVRFAQEFPKIWEDMRAMLLKADIVVAHNAAFDIGQLRNTLQLYALPPVSFQYACTYCITRKLLPKLPNHKLSTMAAYFKHEFIHHDALEDAETCALIASKTGIPDKYIKNFVFS